MPPLQHRRCRLFYHEHERDAAGCGDPLDGSQQETFEALWKFRDSNVMSTLPESPGPVCLGDGPHRKVETLAEVGATAIEIEGEKLVAKRRIAEAIETDDTDTLIGEWRLYRFLVEGQLDYLYAFASVLVNHVAALVLHHPRIPCVDLPSRERDGRWTNHGFP